MQIVVAKRSDAQSITNTMAGQRRMWEEQLSVISSRINSIPGHAMVSAASMYYLSRAPPDKHKELLSNWLGYCSGAVPLGSLELDKNKLQSAQVCESVYNYNVHVLDFIRMDQLLISRSKYVSRLMNFL